MKIRVGNLEMTDSPMTKFKSVKVPDLSPSRRSMNDSMSLMSSPRILPGLRFRNQSQAHTQDEWKEKLRMKHQLLMENIHDDPVIQSIITNGQVSSFLKIQKQSRREMRKNSGLFASSDHSRIGLSPKRVKNEGGNQTGRA